MRQTINSEPIKTVAELVAKLLTLDQDAEPWIECSDDHYSGPITYMSYSSPNADEEQGKGVVTLDSGKS